MVSLGAIVKLPDDFYPLLKLKMASRHAEKHIPSEPHWAFCFSMLHKVSRSFALVIQQLDTQLKNAVSKSAYFIWFFEPLILLKDIGPCVWEIFLPNNDDGSPPIPHGSRVKIRMETPSGVKDSIPAWIKFSVQAPSEIPYSGVYYDPPEEKLMMR